jgi:protein FAM32A
VDAIKEMLEREEERDGDRKRERSAEADGERSERKERERERSRDAEKGGRKMTEAEKRYEEIQRRRVSTPSHAVCLLLAARPELTTSQREERVKKSAKMTHKDRVQEFNSKLDKLRWVVDILRDCVCVCVYAA